MAPAIENKKVPRALRYRRQFFPNAEGMVFDGAEIGFVPVIAIAHLLAAVMPPADADTEQQRHV